MYATSLLIFLIFILLLSAGILKFVGRRISKKLSIRIMIVYVVILILSPMIAEFTVEGIDSTEESRKVPRFYYEDVLDDYQNQSVKALEEDRYLQIVETSEISVDIDAYSKENPMAITSNHRGQEYGHYIVVEPTENIDSIIVTQFSQRFFIDHVDLSTMFDPWNWSLSSGELRANIQQMDVALYLQTPPYLAFHFESGYHISSLSAHDFTFPYYSTIQWIQVPKDLEFHYEGDGPSRIKE